ncbi:hypothetical protein BGX28_009812 [Mortierella sp. GBA30]|nr:hypothetical protein BGX28_009812 [Mortierella sp. GBA30]
MLRHICSRTSTAAVSAACRPHSAFIATLHRTTSFTCRVPSNTAAIDVRLVWKSVDWNKSSLRCYTSSSSSDADIQDLVFKTVSELMQIQDKPDEIKARITLSSRLKADLGLDIFKTYQLLDKLEQDIGEVDISVEDADKAQTLQDIVALVTRK